jgi:hypothetical protein
MAKALPQTTKIGLLPQKLQRLPLIILGIFQLRI